MLQAHRLHRPRSRADVARMGGMAEYNSDVVEHNIESLVISRQSLVDVVRCAGTVLTNN
jgi:hypothetical protein